MEDKNNKRVYSPIGEGRLLDIRVILDGNIVYEGMVEDAPKEIKDLKYSEVKIEDKFVYYVYSELQ